MNKQLKRMLLFFSIFLWATSAGALTVNHNGSAITYGNSWDNPSANIEEVLDGNNLTLVNGIQNEAETWFGKGAFTIIVAELAGYRNATTFGYYLEDGSSQQLFSGADGTGAFEQFTFGAPTTFGFYIDPNGNTANRMYTEHTRNSHNDYQVAIFKFTDYDNKYVLGWEDLDLYGGSGGDRDYQDMILSIEINPAAPVPEPATLFLLGAGLVGLAGAGRKFTIK